MTCRRRSGAGTEHASLWRMEKPPFSLKMSFREAATEHPEFCVVIPIWGRAPCAGASPGLCSDLLPSKGLWWGESIKSSKLGFRVIPAQHSAMEQEKILSRLSFWVYWCLSGLG